MIIVRDVFKIEPDQMKQARELAKEHQEILQQLGYPARRIATDLVGGEYYTLVMESEFEGLADFEEALEKASGDEAWQRFYPKLRSLIRGGHREILKAIE